MYNIDFSRKAQKKLDKLSDAIANPILASIGNLSGNPRPKGYKKLKGRPGYRSRVGDYRVIYEIFDKVLLIDVIDLGHRKEITKAPSNYTHEYQNYQNVPIPRKSCWDFFYPSPAWQ
jgi:mRNA interferase RelE/StbE